MWLIQVAIVVSPLSAVDLLNEKPLKNYTRFVVHYATEARGDPGNRGKVWIVYLFAMSFAVLD